MGKTYKIIFTTGYDDDIESLSKGLKADVLILDGNGQYYCTQFIAMERLMNEVASRRSVCYFEENLVIVDEITKDVILKSIIELDQRLFYEYWKQLSNEWLEKYFYPKDDWVVFTVSIEDK